MLVARFKLAVSLSGLGVIWPPLDNQTRRYRGPEELSYVARFYSLKAHATQNSRYLESTSSLLSGNVARSLDEEYEISGVYRNTPRIRVHNSGPIHYVAVLLRAIGDPPSVFAGEYWTNRETRGN